MSDTAGPLTTLGELVTRYEQATARLKTLRDDVAVQSIRDGRQVQTVLREGRYKAYNTLNKAMKDRGLPAQRAGKPRTKFSQAKPTNDTAVAIKARIDDGTYMPGSELPPVPQLAEEYGVATKSVTAALHALARAGLLTDPSVGPARVPVPEPTPPSPLAGVVDIALTELATETAALAAEITALAARIAADR